MAENIVKKKKKFKRRRNSSVAKFAAMFDNPQNTESKTGTKPIQKKKKKKVKQKVFDNPRHWNNQYILYVQKHNKKPTAPQIGFFCHENIRSLEDRKKIIKLKQSQSIEQIKKERIIHRHHSQRKSGSFRRKPTKKPDISWQWRCDNLQKQLKKLKEKHEPVSPVTPVQPKTISEKKPRDDAANMLIEGYFRLVLHIEVPDDIVSCCYLLFYEYGMEWQILWGKYTNKRHILYKLWEKQFTKLTIVDRFTYATILANSPTNVATVWTNGNKTINENQELLDDWSYKRKFCFYGVEYNVTKYLNIYNGDEKELLCSRKYYDRENQMWLDVLVARETTELYIILAKQYKNYKGAAVTSTFVKAAKFIDDYSCYI